MDVSRLDPEMFGDTLALWEATGLGRPWNDPRSDLNRALDGPTSTVLAGFYRGVGYEDVDVRVMSRWL